MLILLPQIIHKLAKGGGELSFMYGESRHWVSHTGPVSSLKSLDYRLDFTRWYGEGNLVVLGVGEYPVTATSQYELALVNQHWLGNLFTAGTAAKASGGNRLPRSINVSLYQSGYLGWITIDYEHMRLELSSM